MQHNPQKPNHTNGRNNEKQHGPATANQFDIRNVYPKKMHVKDAGHSPDDPDKIRRQKQDYFDNWKLTSKESF